MIEKLKDFLQKNRAANSQLIYFDEAKTKNAFILPILHLLGWDIFNVDEVYPEYSVENRRVDYSLRIKDKNEVFLEAKKTSENLESHEDQLLEYSFRQGIELAILTNGITWWFYLPTKKGEWKNRKFYTIDILNQDQDDIAEKFIGLLTKQNVQSGSSLQYAETIYKGKIRNKSIKETLPNAWNSLIEGIDPMLLDLLSDATEKLCGYKPELSEVSDFIKNHKNHLIVAEQNEKIRELDQFKRFLIQRHSRWKKQGMMSKQASTLK